MFHLLASSPLLTFFQTLQLWPLISTNHITVEPLLSGHLELLNKQDAYVPNAMFAYLSTPEIRTRH